MQKSIRVPIMYFFFNVVSSPELLGCFSLTHAVTVFRGNMPSAIKKSKVAVSAADSGKKKNKVEKYFMDNSGVNSFCLI